MSIEESGIKCAKCDATLQIQPDPKPDSRVSCPVCGLSENFEQITREVAEYVADHAGDLLMGDLDRATRHNKTVKFTERPRPKKAYRFVVDLEPHRGN